MAGNPRIKYTYRDYLLLPESEERRYELVEGELYMVPSPTPSHQDIVFRLARIMDDFVQRYGLGKVYIAPLDVVLSEEDVLQPDILFVASDRRSIITERNIRGAPDLVVEVLSPGTADRDRFLKRTRYAKFGVREYWVVDPETKAIEVLVATQAGLEVLRTYPLGTVATSGILDGLQVEVTKLFA